MNQRKEEAIILRKKGYSYNMINARLGISKSTLSCWFKEMPFTPNAEVAKRIKNGPLVSGTRRHNEKVKNIAKIKNLARKEIGKIAERDLWMVGIGLYIGEGAKTYEITRIINSDPKVIKLAIKWFKNICKLSDENILCRIHLYPDNDIKKCLDYWIKETKLPRKNFQKIQIDTRDNKSGKKKRMLPYGTAHVTIRSNGNSDFGVNLHRRITGWMEKVLEN